MQPLPPVAHLRHALTSWSSYLLDNFAYVPSEDKFVVCIFDKQIRMKFYAIAKLDKYKTRVVSIKYCSKDIFDEAWNNPPNIRMV